MQSSTDRGRRIGRHAILWLAGPIVLIARDGLGALAPPTRCAAALDLLAIAILRRWPDLTIGQLLAWLQPIVIAIALMCVVEWCYHLTRNIGVALAIGVMLGFSPAFSAFLAPPTEAAAVGVCAAIALSARGITNGAGLSRARLAFAATMLLLAALVVPSWSAACALAMCALGWWCPHPANRRVRVAVAFAIAALVGAAPIVMLRITHVAALGGGAPWYACATPTPNVSVWLQQTSSPILRMIGPVVIALAALGSAVELFRAGSARILAVGGLVALASVPASSAQPEVVLGALIVCTWSVAAIGLEEIFSMMRPARGGLVAVTVLLCALPALEVARVRGEERDNAVRSVSQERASLAAITSILNLVPSDARFVEEDASVDLLLRASLIGGRRATKPFTVIPAARHGVGRAIQDSTVWAFPHGQELLALRGFEIQQPGDLPVHGLARVTSARSCQELGTSWVDLSAEGRHGRIAIVADFEADSGPVVLYFGGPTEYAPGPDGWAPRVRTGFEVRLFDRSTPADAARLDAEARELHLEAQAVFGAAFVSRVYVRRTPLSPLELPVVLGPPRPTGVGRLREDASPADRIAVCDAPPVTVSKF